MDGFTTQPRIAACWAIAFASVALFFVPRANAQALCDAGNPCSRSDIASHAGIGPSTGVHNPIDVVSGNKYQAEIDFQLPGELALSFTRHYNSASVQGGAFGGGWSHTYETALTRVERSGTATITIAQGDGRRITFEATGGLTDGVQRYVSSPYGYGVIDEDVSQLEMLRRTPTYAIARAHPWRWTWSEGRQLTFDERGALSRIQTASGEWLTLEYDEHHRLSRLIDFVGRELRLSYWDQPSEWLRSYDGTQLQGARHRLESLRLPDGRLIRYGYDANGLLSEARFADGTRKRYEYAETGGALRLARVFGRDGRVAGAYRYDADGFASNSAFPSSTTRAIDVERLAASRTHETSASVVTNAAGEPTTYRWRQTQLGAQLLEVTGPGCSTCPASNVRYRYDERALVDRIDRLAPDTHDVEWSELITRDAVGRVLERLREQNGIRTLIERFEYEDDDPLAKPARIIRPSIAHDRVRTVSLRYNDRGQPLRITESGYAPIEGGLDYSSIQRSTAYEYYEPKDRAAHLVGRLKHIDGPLPGLIDRTQYEYDARGLLSKIVYSNGAAERFEYDVLGRLRQHVPLDGIAIDLEYDNEGRIASYARAGLRTRILYDADGRITRLHDPIGQQVSFEYDGSALKALEDVGGNRIEFAIDDYGRPMAQRLLNPDGTIAQVRSPHLEMAAELDPEPQSFSPAALSFIRLPIVKSWTTAAETLIEPVSAESVPRSHEQAVDQRGLISDYRYDDFGRLAYVFNPDAGSLSLEYDDASRIVARRFADGRTIRYAFDALGRVETISAGSDQVHIDYGPYNKPAILRYAWGEEAFEFDLAGRLTRRTQRIDGRVFTRSYEYDELGRRSEATLPDGSRLRYRYNGSVHAKPGVLASIERAGLFTTTPIITGLNEAGDGYARAASRFGNGLAFARELDVQGRLTRFGTPGVAYFEFETDAAGRIVSLDHDRHRFFSYDAAGRLERASSARMDDVAFGFDAAGNARFIASRGTQTLLRVAHASNRVLERTDANGRRTQYAYDAAGRTTRIGDRELEYDAFGRTARILDNGQTLAEYSYNAFGERIRKVVHSGSGRSVTYFFYDDSKLTAEADEQGRVTKQFVYLQDRAVAMLVGADTYAVHTDWLGTPVAITDEDQRVAWRASTDPLGRIHAQHGSLRLDLRGSNQYFDQETGLHYNLHRYFDPATSRYLTPDPIGQLGGLNLYAFANGDPINFVDPLGQQAIPADYETTDRLRVVLQGTIEALPEALRDSVGEAIQELLNPEALAVAAAIFVAWGVSHLTPFGWAADLLLVGLGVAFMGAAVVDLVRGTAAAYRAMRDARTIQELCAAGRAFARTLTDAVIELAGGGGLATAARRSAGDVAAQIRRAFGRPSRPPPPAPLPWTQEMLQSVTDGFGNRIRTFMAGRNHMWRTEAERLRWQSLEDAATSFARNYFDARYVIDAKHMNGALDHPNSTQGFDLVFVTPDGRLVIGEAKSGQQTREITAFGAGRRGEEQLDLNLRVLRERVERDLSIPDDVKQSIVRQIDTRSFETHLYIPPRTTIRARDLDIFQEALGRPLDAIYILPEELPALD